MSKFNLEEWIRDQSFSNNLVENLTCKDAKIIHAMYRAGMETMADRIINWVEAEKFSEDGDFSAVEYTVLKYMIKEILGKEQGEE